MLLNYASILRRSTSSGLRKLLEDYEQKQTPLARQMICELVM
jgi:hypothetical protein